MIEVLSLSTSLGNLIVYLRMAQVSFPMKTSLLIPQFRNLPVSVTRVPPNAGP